MSDNIAPRWKAILDSLRDAKAERQTEYRYGTYDTLQDQLDAKIVVNKAEKAYNDALDACLGGQDPIAWKLSYNGR